MADDDLAGFLALKEQFAQLRADFYSHAKDTNEKLQKIFEFISEEMGARKERDKNEAIRSQGAELSRNTIMAMAAVMGAVMGAMQAAVSIFHPFH